MPKNALMMLIINGKDNTILIFLYTELFIFLIYIDTKYKVCCFCEGKKLLLGHICMGLLWKEGHFDVSNVDLGEDLLLLGVIFLHLFDHS